MLVGSTRDDSEGRRTMTGMGLSRPRGVSRIFFQEIREGDRRKLEARSNDAATGGGARDLRAPHEKFESMFRRMFPNDKVVNRRRDGMSVQVTLYTGKLYWVDGDDERSVDVVYEPPTTARPSEGRIARIHDLPVLANGVPAESEGRVFLLLVQRDDGKVFAHYATANALASGGWNKDIATAIRQCMQATPESHSVRGYVDYVKPERYCHA